MFEIVHNVLYVIFRPAQDKIEHVVNEYMDSLKLGAAIGCKRFLLRYLELQGMRPVTTRLICKRNKVRERTMWRVAFVLNLRVFLEVTGTWNCRA